MRVSTVRTIALSCAAMTLAPAVLAQESDSEAPASDSIVWKPGWRRVGWLEYGLTLGLASSSFAFGRLVAPEDDADWKRPILFDDGARDAFRMRSKSGRATAAAVSDGLFVGAVAYPFADAALVAWLGHGSPDVAWQMVVIDAQAMSTSVFLASLAKRGFARERPYGSACDEDPDYREGCDTATRNRSFFSGHAAFTATAAGLTCAHHAHLPLYGGGAADGAACGIAVAFTTTTGVLRIASDNHWASDVVTGHIIGFSTGLLMPWLLYYDAEGAPPPSSAWFVMPSAGEGGLGVAASGWF